MTYKQAIGWTLVSSPFIAILASLAVDHGIRAVLQSLLIVAAALCILVLGTTLIRDI